MRNPSGVVLTRFTAEVAVALGTAGIGAVVAFGAREFGTGWGDAGPQPGYFPFYVGLIIVAASAGVLLEAVVRRRTRASVFLTREQAGRVLAFVGPILGFVVLSILLGLYVALVVYLTGTMVLAGRFRLLHALAISFGAAVAFYAVFELWFKVPLLKGPLEALLKLN